MSNVVPESSLVSSDAGIAELLGDFYLVNKLLQNPRYNIPEHVRDKVINVAVNVLDSSLSKPNLKIQAAKLVLEADKRNLDLIKLIKPQKHQHVNVKDRTDEELQALVGRAMKLLPREIIDVEGDVL